MELTLDSPQGEITHEAELISARGDYLSGTLRFEFKGEFPVDPKPFMSPPPPEVDPRDGWYCYEVPRPKASVGIKTDSNYYVCRVESVRSGGFILAPHMAVNLRALQNIKV
jgi:hypothetical protein